jgi:hypothetical protein
MGPGLHYCIKKPEGQACIIVLLAEQRNLLNPREKRRKENGSSILKETGTDLFNSATLSVEPATRTRIRGSALDVA